MKDGYFNSFKSVTYADGKYGRNRGPYTLARFGSKQIAYNGSNGPEGQEGALVSG